MNPRYFVCVNRQDEPLLTKWKCPNQSFMTMKEAEDWAVKQGEIDNNHVVGSRLFVKSFYMPYTLSAYTQLRKEGVKCKDIEIE